MIRALPLLALAATAGCAPPAVVVQGNGTPVVMTPAGLEPTAAETEGRMILERDVAAALGPGVLAEALAAPSAVLVRRPVSFPRQVQQADGRWVSEPPNMAVAVRTNTGWVRITREGRQPLEITAAGQIDRLLARHAVWSEPLGGGGCTDGSGTGILIRNRAMERFSFHPCGFAGDTGEIGEIVFGGQIRDWTRVPPELRPGGLPIGRFAEESLLGIRYNSGIQTARNLDIRSEAEWVGQWLRITSGRSGAPPAVDFSQEMVLLAAMGTQRSGGYRVSIDRVVPRGDGYEVFVRHISPGPHCGVTAALTQPIDLARVPRTDRPVRWTVERDVSDCR